VTQALTTGSQKDEDKGFESLQNLGLGDIGINLEALSRDIGIVDSTETMSLNREFSIPGFIRISDGRGGLPKVTLTHPSGSATDIYLHGANILSWVLANGGEVFYTPDGIPFSDAAPIEWGTPFCFPQFGEGGERAGTPPSLLNPLPVDGFANTMQWSIVQTSLGENKRGEFPYVVIELKDTEASRAMWNHNFHLTMEISLEHTAIDVVLKVKNTGTTNLEYAAALKSHVAIADALQPSMSYVGLDKCVFLDNTVHPTKPRVRFTEDLENDQWLHLDGRTDRVYLNTKNDTGVEVGTGCTVFLRNMCPVGVNGFGDRAVFNPWVEGSAEHYRWYTGLAIGAIGKLIKVEPEREHTSQMRFEVVDVVQTQMKKDRKEMYKKLSVGEMTKRPVYDLLVHELPTDLQ